MEERRSISVQITDALGENDVLPNDFAIEAEEIEGFKFAPGAMDGITIYHMGYSELDDAEKEKLGEILSLVAWECDEIFDLEDAIDEFCKVHRAITIMDDITQYVISHQDKLNAGNVRMNAERLTLESVSIECVKVGLILLELFKPDDFVEVIANTLGRYDEFTIFSIFLLGRFKDGSNKILELAKSVKGWGRIHCIFMMNAESDEIKDWILKNGVDNCIMPAYSGLDTFNKADVRGILKRDRITREELTAILKIIGAMLDEGPVDGISALEDAFDVLVQVLEKAAALLPLDISDYQIIKQIDEWQKENAEGDNPELERLMNEMFYEERARKQIKV